MSEAMPEERQLTEEEGRKVLEFLDQKGLKDVWECFDNGYCKFCEEKKEHFGPNDVKGMAFHILDNHI